MEQRPIKFPEDELKHNTLGEWWYFNGNLKSADGREFGFMNTLFRANIPVLLKKVIKYIPSKDIYFYHSILTDVGKDKFYPHIDLISIVSRDSFRQELLNVAFTSPTRLLNSDQYFIKEFKPFCYHVKGEGIDLSMESSKQPLLEGETGYLENLGKATYYYSLTNLKTTGKIIVEGEEIEVTGKSWLDHQWADAVVSNDFWDWFSIQLDGDIELICYKYGRGDQFSYLATISYPRSRQKSFTELEITPMGKSWRSHLTKVEYPLVWHINIPQEKISLTVEAKVTDHEMNFLSINYWESPTKISGKINGKSIKGEGYMELAGRSSVFSHLRHLKS